MNNAAACMVHDAAKMRQKGGMPPTFKDWPVKKIFTKGEDFPHGSPDEEMTTAAALAAG